MLTYQTLPIYCAFIARGERMARAITARRLAMAKGSDRPPARPTEVLSYHVARFRRARDIALVRAILARRAARALRPCTSQSPKPTPTTS